MIIIFRFLSIFKLIMSHHLNFDLNSHDANRSSPKTKKPDVGKGETKKLEIDNKQMEWRLNQLKAAMEREKEERGKRSYFWKSGREGALESHARNVLGKTVNPKSTTKKESKKVKVTILTDEPLDIPKRTMHSKDLIDKLMKPTPPQKKSSDTETYADINKECWITIGLDRFSDEIMELQSDRDGNLPLATLHGINPAAIGLFYLRYGRKRLLLAVNNKVMQPKSGWGNETYYPYITDTSPQKMLIEPAPPSSTRSPKSDVTDRSDFKSKDGGLFLNGSFNEEENAKLFQEAVLAWRNSKTPVNTFQSTTISGAVHPSVEKSVHDVQSDPIKGAEIKFSQTSTLTFMEKILLNKHRKTDVPPLPITCAIPNNENVPFEEDCNFTPEENDERDRYRQLFTPQPSVDISNSNFNEHVCTIIEVDSDSEELMQSSTNFIVNEASDNEHAAEEVNAPSNVRNTFNLDASVPQNKKHSAIESRILRNTSNKAQVQNPQSFSSQNEVAVTGNLLNAISNIPLNPDAVYHDNLDKYCSNFVSEQAQLQNSLSINANEIFMCRHSSHWFIPTMDGEKQMDGARISNENLTIVSQIEDRVDSEQEDFDALERLEWELASRTGNITSDGRISRIIDEWSSDESDSNLGIVNDPGLGSGLSTPDHEPMTVVGNSWQDDSEMLQQFQRMEELMLDDESTSRQNSDSV